MIVTKDRVVITPGWEEEQCDQEGRNRDREPQGQDSVS